MDALLFRFTSATILPPKLGLAFAIRIGTMPKLKYVTLYCVASALIAGSIMCALSGHVVWAVPLMYFGAPAMRAWVDMQEL